MDQEPAGPVAPRSPSRPGLSTSRSWASVVAGTTPVGNVPLLPSPLCSPAPACRSAPEHDAEGAKVISDCSSSNSSDGYSDGYQCADEPPQVPPRLASRLLPPPPPLRSTSLASPPGCGDLPSPITSVSSLEDEHASDDDGDVEGDGDVCVTRDSDAVNADNSDAVGVKGDSDADNDDDVGVEGDSDAADDDDNKDDSQTDAGTVTKACDDDIDDDDDDDNDDNGEAEMTKQENEASLAVMMPPSRPSSSRRNVFDTSFWDQDTPDLPDAAAAAPASVGPPPPVPKRPSIKLRLPSQPPAVPKRPSVTLNTSGSGGSVGSGGGSVGIAAGRKLRRHGSLTSTCSLASIREDAPLPMGQDLTAGTPPLLPVTATAVTPTAAVAVPPPVPPRRNASASTSTTAPAATIAAPSGPPPPPPPRRRPAVPVAAAAATPASSSPTSQATSRSASPSPPMSPATSSDGPVAYSASHVSSDSEEEGITGFAASRAVSYGSLRDYVTHAVEVLSDGSLDALDQVPSPVYQRQHSQDEHVWRDHVCDGDSDGDGDGEFNYSVSTSNTRSDAAYAAAAAGSTHEQAESDSVVSTSPRSSSDDRHQAMLARLASRPISGLSTLRLHHRQALEHRNRGLSDLASLSATGSTQDSASQPRHQRSNSIGSADVVQRQESTKTLLAAWQSWLAVHADDDGDMDQDAQALLRDMLTSAVNGGSVRRTRGGGNTG